MKGRGGFWDRLVGSTERAEEAEEALELAHRLRDETRSRLVRRERVAQENNFAEDIRRYLEARAS